MIKFGQFPVNSFPTNSFPEYANVGSEVNTITCSGNTSVNGEKSKGFGIIKLNTSPSVPITSVDTDSGYSYSNYADKIKDKSGKLRKIKPFLGRVQGVSLGQSAKGSAHVYDYKVYKNEELERLILIMSEL
jgi:hypothetical protein